MLLRSAGLVAAFPTDETDLRLRRRQVSPYAIIVKIADLISASSFSFHGPI